MTKRLALMATIALAGCGGSVDHPSDNAAGGAPMGPGRPHYTVAGAGASFSDDAADADIPVGSGGAGDAAGGPLMDDGGEGGAVESPPELTRTLIVAPQKPRGFLGGAQYRRDADTAPVYTLEAHFETNHGQWDGCTQVRLGECWYYDCPPGATSLLPSATQQDAGTVSLTPSGASASKIDFGLLSKYWYQADATGQLWSDSLQVLTFAGSGSVVPAFSLAMRSPPTVALLSLNGEAAPKSIARSAGVDLHWSSSGTGVAYFSLAGLHGQKSTAVCEFDASANAGQLPAVLLQALEPGPDYYLIFRGVTRARTDVGEWEFDANLLGYGGPVSPFDSPSIELR
jgi:hypothetical protein